MRRLHVLPLLLPLVCGGALAQSAQVDPAARERATISREDCVRLTTHTPDPDVEYRPGADDVVPADIDPVAPIEVPRDFSIYIEGNVRQPRQPRPLYRPYVDIGRVDYRDGQLFFNGQALTPPEEARVRYLCSEALTR
jgi:hypothetical protein